MTLSAPSKLSGVKLNVLSPETLAEFYVQNLGMSLSVKGQEFTLGYENGGADIILIQSPTARPYQYSKTDLYWKIGITLPNIDLAHEQLSSKGVAVTEPRQFRDIGYLCHLTDPEGFQVELLQHTFEGQPRTSDGDNSLPLGGGAQIGQITLRSTDIEKDLAHYQYKLGMKLLSIQPITEYGFDLYFLAFTDEVPPNPDLKHVDNRPWLWQRPYTTLEIQYLLDADVIIRTCDETETGYVGFQYSLTPL